MTTEKIPPHVAALAATCGVDAQGWVNQCHRASLDIVKSGVFPGARVARGRAHGVISQHSWVVIGDPYDEAARIIDPTLWCYVGDVDDVWEGTGRAGRHVPHGSGNIWAWGPPQAGDGEIWTLEADLSVAARAFLDVCGPLDVRGWMELFNSPVGGWPAGEIIAAAADDERLTDLIPIDVLGMITDRNPGGLYLEGLTQ